MRKADDLWKTYDWAALQADRDMFEHVMTQIQADAAADMRERAARCADYFADESGYAREIAKDIRALPLTREEGK